MSADNGIYVLSTIHPNDINEREYRVAYLMAVDNLAWDEETKELSDDPDVMIKNAREMWGNSTVFDDGHNAWDYARILNQGQYTEYGIVEIKIERIF